MKKIKLSWLLVVTMICALLPFQVHAKDSIDISQIQKLTINYHKNLNDDQVYYAVDYSIGNSSKAFGFSDIKTQEITNVEGRKNGNELETIPNSFISTSGNQKFIGWIMKPTIDSSNTILAMNQSINEEFLKTVQEDINYNDGQYTLDVYGFWEANPQNYILASYAPRISFKENKSKYYYEDSLIPVIQYQFKSTDKKIQFISYAYMQYASWLSGMNQFLFGIDKRYELNTNVNYSFDSNYYKVSNVNKGQSYFNYNQGVKYRNNVTQTHAQITVDYSKNVKDDDYSYMALAFDKNSNNYLNATFEDFINGFTLTLDSNMHTLIKENAYEDIANENTTVKFKAGVAFAGRFYYPGGNKRSPEAGFNQEETSSTIQYAKKVKLELRFEDENGKSIQDSKIFNDFLRQTINLSSNSNNVYPEGFDDQTNKSIISDNHLYILKSKRVEGKTNVDFSNLPDENNIIVYTYQKVGRKVILNYVDQNNQIIKSETVVPESTLEENHLDERYNVSNKYVNEILDSNNISYTKDETQTPTLEGVVTDEPQVITFKYKKNVEYQSIPLETQFSINKILQNSTFKFQIQLIEGNKNNIEDYQDKTLTINQNGSIDFGAYKFLQPGTYKFKIKQIENTEDPYHKYYTYDQNEDIVTITISQEVKDHKAYLKASSVTHSKNVFENVYHAPDLSTLNQNFKSVTYANGEIVDNTQSIRYTLSEDETNDKTGYNAYNHDILVDTKDGKAKLPNIHFIKPGVYLFSLKRQSEDTRVRRSPISYDESTYVLKVNVDENRIHDLPEISKVTLLKDNVEVDNIVFENNITGQEIIIAPKIESQLKPSTSSISPTTFILKDTQNNKEYRKILNQNSQGTFDPIIYDKPDVYTFRIYQLSGDEKNVVYDNSEYTYKVTLKLENNILKKEESYNLNDEEKEKALFVNHKVETLQVKYYLNYHEAESREKVHIATYDLLNPDSPRSSITSNLGYTAGNTVEYDKDRTKAILPYGKKYYVDNLGTDHESYELIKEEEMSRGFLALNEKLNYFWSFTPVYDQTKFNDPYVHMDTRMDAKFFNEVKDHFVYDEEGNATLKLYGQWETSFELMKRVGATNTKDMFAEIYVKNVDQLTKPNPTYGQFVAHNFENFETPLSIDQSQDFNFNASLEYDDIALSNTVTTRAKLSVLYNFMYRVKQWKGDMVTLLDDRLKLDKNIRVLFESTWLKPNLDKLHDAGVIKIDELPDVGAKKRWIFTVDKDKIMSTYTSLPSETENNVNDKYLTMRIPTVINRDHLKEINFDEFMETMRLSVVNEDNEETGLNAYIDENAFNTIASSENPVIKVKGYNDILLTGQSPGTVVTLGSFLGKSVAESMFRSYINSDPTPISHELPSLSEDFTEFYIPSQPIAKTEYIRLYPSGRAEVEYVIDDEKDDIKLREDAHLWGRSKNPHKENVGLIHNYTNIFSLYDKKSGNQEFDKTIDINHKNIIPDVLSNLSFMKNGQKYVFYGARINNEDVDTKTNKNVILFNDKQGLRKLLQNKDFLYSYYLNEENLPRVDRTQRFTFLYRKASGPVKVRYFIEGTNIQIHDSIQVYTNDDPVGLTYNTTTPNIRFGTIKYQGNIYQFVRHRKESDNEIGVNNEREKVIDYEYKLIQKTPEKPHKPITPITPTIPNNPPKPNSPNVTIKINKKTKSNKKTINNVSKEKVKTNDEMNIVPFVIMIGISLLYFIKLKKHRKDD